MTIISYGCPRTGTHFVRKCYQSIPFVHSNNLRYKLRQCYNYKYQDKHRTSGFDEMTKQVNALVETFHAKEDKDVLYIMVSEGLIIHPLNDLLTQTNFNWLIDLCPKPIKLFRTYRRAANFFKSMQRWNYQDFTQDSRNIAMVALIEHTLYNTLSKNFDIISVDFDKFDDEAYLSHHFKKLNHAELEKALLDQIKKKFTPFPDRDTSKHKISDCSPAFCDKVDELKSDITALYKSYNHEHNTNKC